MTIAGKSIRYFEGLGNRDYAIVPHKPTNDVRIFDRRTLRYSGVERKPWKENPLPLVGNHYPDYETAIAAVTEQLTADE